jgi:hypothetical protein
MKGFWRWVQKIGHEVECLPAWECTEIVYKYGCNVYIG